jgi:hypothetical protein
VNYLRLDRVPPADDWSAIVPALQRGDFFTTTGEVLIRDFRATAAGAAVELDWTFPLDHLRLVWSISGRRHERTERLAATAEHGSGRFEIVADLAGADWVRLDAWDVARNGAFTQAIAPR